MRPDPRSWSSHRQRPSVAAHRRCARGSFVAICMLLLSLHGGSGWAAPIAKFDVPRQGGAYVVKVHPDVLTAFYFPADIIAAYCIQQPAPMVVKQHAQSVTVQPLPGMTHASVNVSTKRFRVGILLEVVDRPEDATLQAEFRDLDLAREFESRVQLEVDRRMLHREDALKRDRAELTQQKTSHDQIVEDTAVQRVADGIRTHHRILGVTGQARKAFVVLRVVRVVWLGPDAYVVFSIQNRRTSPYRLGAVALQVDAQERTGAVSFPGGQDAAQRGIVGIVPAKDQQTGVVVLRDAARWVGETVAVHALEDHETDAGTGLPLTASFVLRN